MPTALQQRNRKNAGKRLTDEQRLAIPYIYALTGSRQATADELGTSLPTVDRWLKNTPREEMERIQEDQRKELIARSLEIVYKCMEKIVKRLDEAKVYELVGAVKIFRESLVAWGGVGATEAKDSTQNELQNILKAAEERKFRDAVEEAYATRDFTKLEPYVAIPVAHEDQEGSD
jgi:hypothetical protein